MLHDTMTSTQDPSAHEPSVTRLVTGIIDDAQELLREQIRLFKHEVRRDLKDAR